MKTLPVTATDDQIRALVVEWSELLAARRFGDALAMFPCADEEMDWTAESLANWISNYGFDEPYPDGKRFTLTSLLDLPTSQRAIEKCIEVDRENLYGLPPESYLGMVHYNDVPLDNEPSDLTARFHIKKIGTDQMTLELYPPPSAKRL